MLLFDPIEKELELLLFEWEECWPNAKANPCIKTVVAANAGELLKILLDADWFWIVLLRLKFVGLANNTLFEIEDWDWKTSEDDCKLLLLFILKQLFVEWFWYSDWLNKFWLILLAKFSQP